MQIKGDVKQMVTRDIIFVTLDGFYPNHQKLTPMVIQEIDVELNQLEVTDDEFTGLIAVYRRNPKQCDWPPMAAKLVSLIPSLRSGQSNVTNNEKNTAFRDFTHNVEYLGWPEALRVAKELPTQARVLEDKNVTDMSDKYCCYDGWYVVFLEILHSGDVVGAYDYASQNTEGIQRDRFERLAFHFNWINKTSDQKHAKSYFPVLRPKGKKGSFDKFYANIKNRSRQAKTI